jgi:hypothetical protein
MTRKAEHPSTICAGELKGAAMVLSMVTFWLGARY